MMDQSTVTEALVWVALAFAAGFISFFGKSLGRKVISLFQKGHDKEEAVLSEKKPGSSLPQVSVTGREDGEKEVKKSEKTRMKLEKKLLKKKGQEES